MNDLFCHIAGASAKWIVNVTEMFFNVNVATKQTLQNINCDPNVHFLGR